MLPCVSAEAVRLVRRQLRLLLLFVLEFYLVFWVLPSLVRFEIPMASQEPHLGFHLSLPHVSFFVLVLLPVLEPPSSSSPLLFFLFVWLEPAPQLLLPLLLPL